MTYPKLKQSDIPKETKIFILEYFLKHSVPKIIEQRKEQLNAQ